MTTLFVTHPIFLEHHTGWGHPERADRLRVIEQALDVPLFSNLLRCHAPKGHWEQVRLVHTETLIRQLQGAIPDSGFNFVDSDTVLSPASIEAALYATGAVCFAVDTLFSGQARNAFCAVRPPGHHAEPNRAMGFCLFNHVAIGIEYLRSHYSVNKVALIDFDVHHGNGSECIFGKNPQVSYVSLHQFPWYPGTGHAKDTGVGNVMNCLLPSGSGGETLRSAFTDSILPFLDQFAPEWIFLSAGFDAHRDDPLGELNWIEEDYKWITEALMRLADQHAKGRIVSVLEGGYHLDALAKSVSTHVLALMNG